MTHRQPSAWLMDLDGVLVREEHLIPGADRFLARLVQLGLQLRAGHALEAHSELTAMIGDRTDTDIVAGIEAGMETILVLSGVSTRTDAERFPYRPSRIVDSVADLVDSLS